MIKEEKQFVYSIFDSLSYIRSKEWMAGLATEVKARIREEEPDKLTDDGDFIYGTFVRMFGDFSEEPRLGWIFGDNVKNDLIEVIKEFEQSL